MEIGDIDIEVIGEPEKRGNLISLICKITFEDGETIQERFGFKPSQFVTKEGEELPAWQRAIYRWAEKYKEGQKVTKSHVPTKGHKVKIKKAVVKKKAE